MASDVKATFEKQKLVLDRARMALATGDLDALIGTFAPGAVHKTLEGSGWVSTPRHGLKELLRQRMSGQKEPVWLTNQRRVRVRNLSMQDVVVSEGILMGALPSGRSVAQPVLTIAEFDKNAAIAEERLYYDMVAARGGAIGNIPPRAPATDLPSDAPWVVAEGTPEEVSNTDTAKSFLMALRDADVRSAADMLHEDATYIDQSFGIALNGRASFCEALVNLLRLFQNVSLSITGIWAADRYVVAETVLSGIVIEPDAPRGANANDCAAIIHSAQVFEIDAGSVRRCSAYRSLAELSTALRLPLTMRNDDSRGMSE